LSNPVTYVLVVLYHDRDNIICLDAKINGHVFLNLNESRLTQFGISLGFKFAIMSIIEDMVSSREVSSVALLQLVPVM
jgi:hypothetical protein